ncbi:hypothetical protein J2S76_004176 [Ancylobacter vacuolatus]|uniref:MarR family transcriptional regulator n=1 Tax=Ancylobacter vacuolatus TaxID=223389 RepID=A0ABU0DMR3_9HYPH|nr:hypothetical protein [Ancylobacter vacuolatus]MDQ0349725.1 hypothetical protein [Ancylobacter vacuolatus]
MPSNLDHLLMLRQEAQRLHDRLRAEPGLSLAGHIASMLVLALAEHIADSAGPPPSGSRRH